MTNPSARLTFRFGEFVFDPAAYELRRNETRIPLPRQSMDLLGLLLERAGDVVSRDEIVNHLWSPDVFVDQDAGIRTAVLRIRQALGESRAAPASSRRCRPKATDLPVRLTSLNQDPLSRSTNLNAFPRPRVITCLVSSPAS